MKPYLLIPYIGELHTNSLLVLLSLFLSALMLCFYMHRELRDKRVRLKGLSGLLLGTFVCGFLGARFFHVIVERPMHFWSHPEFIFTRFDGMTFYGALGASLFFIYIYQKKMHWGLEVRQKVWDLGTLCTCLTLGLMKLGCFANGCCWGKISSHSWAVQYFDERSLMPYIGIPVHPVQLYDSLLALCLGAVLWLIWREGYAKGRLLLYFILFYPVMRFSTEFFRADSYRGEDIIWGMSTSQLISLLLFMVAVFILIRQKFGLQKV